MISKYQNNFNDIRKYLRNPIKGRYHVGYIADEKQILKRILHVGEGVSKIS